MQTQELMEAARLSGHSDAAIARRIGVTPAYLCDAIAGRKHLSPEAAALLADLVGRDPVQAMARQAVENQRDPEKKERLRKALFACWASGVALALSTPPDAQATHVERSPTVNTLHIVRTLLLRLLRTLCMLETPCAKQDRVMLDMPVSRNRRGINGLKLKAEPLRS